LQEAAQYIHADVTPNLPHQTLTQAEGVVCCPCDAEEAGDAARAIDVAWWTDHVGRRHWCIEPAPLRGDRDPYSFSMARTRRLQQHPLELIYPELAWLSGKQGRGQVLCGCGAVGAPAELAWMGECCGPCFDRRQDGEQPGSSAYGWRIAAGAESMAVTPSG